MRDLDYSLEASCALGFKSLSERGLKGSSVVVLFVHLLSAWLLHLQEEVRRRNCGAGPSRRESLISFHDQLELAQAPPRCCVQYTCFWGVCVCW